MASNVKERVLKLLAPIAEQMEIYLVDVENARMGKSRLLRIYVDCDGGIDMNRCEAFHRAITDVLEEIDYDYLEVSSPGDRPLKSDMDFVRLTGREVEVHLYAARDGKRSLKASCLAELTASSASRQTRRNFPSIRRMYPLYAHCSALILTDTK